MTVHIPQRNAASARRPALRPMGAAMVRALGALREGPATLGGVMARMGLTYDDANIAHSALKRLCARGEAVQIGRAIDARAAGVACFTGPLKIRMARSSAMVYATAGTLSLPTAGTPRKKSAGRPKRIEDAILRSLALGAASAFDIAGAFRLDAGNVGSSLSKLAATGIVVPVCVEARGRGGGRKIWALPRGPRERAERTALDALAAAGPKQPISAPAPDLPGGGAYLHPARRTIPQYRWHLSGFLGL